MQETLKEHLLQLFPVLKESYPEVDLPGLAVGSLFAFLATLVLIILLRLIGRLSSAARHRVVFLGKDTDQIAFHPAAGTSSIAGSPPYNHRRSDNSPVADFHLPLLPLSQLRF